MEQHHLHGTIIAELPPVEPTLIERFRGHDTAKLCDSMGGYGAMHYTIKPLEPTMRAVGRALTVLTRPGDALYVQKAIDLTSPGDVIVISAGGLEDVSVIGERLGYFFKLKGAAAIIVDGAIRDSQGMIDQAPPTYAKASCIRIFGSQGPGAINVPVTCGGVGVNPGDIIVADRDGVVVVPLEDAARVADLADQHLEGELERVKEVEAGGSVTDVFGLDGKLARWSGR